MNPVLLKPQADRTSQLVVHGKVRGALNAGNFRTARAELLDAVLASYDRLKQQLHKELQVARQLQLDMVPPRQSPL